MTLRFEVSFNIGDAVYLKTDIEQLPRLVVGYRIMMHEVLYEIQQATLVSTHYAFEISGQPDVLRNTTN